MRPKNRYKLKLEKAPLQADAFFRQRAGNATGEGLLRYLDRAANEPPTTEDRLG